MSSWVNVTNKLPDTNREVLLHVYGRVHVAILQEGVGDHGPYYYFEDTFNDNLNWDVDQVDAWHPMISYNRE